ncbi:hypothetical protein ACTTAK_10835 [Rhodobacter capsulatus]|jgi:hypothetical protein|nr:hypothetical protein [Rhodobacter capsulatus]ETD01354.1 hypothetical protein U714_11855 [Rhodobacter capsulatus DE442]ETD76241.1 hypothetical protein U717_12020 [Rhodobacter capsulatus R121]ETE53388.1 hypothetical protein U715_12025 [Rhodobacter capsulatus Y262]
MLADRCEEAAPPHKPILDQSARADDLRFIMMGQLTKLTPTPQTA